MTQMGTSAEQIAHWNDMLEATIDAFEAEEGNGPGANWKVDLPDVEVKDGAFAVEVKDVMAALAELAEVKRVIRTEEGAKKFGKPIGSVIGRAGKTQHPVSHQKLNRIEVVHNQDGSKQVVQHHAAGRMQTTHTSMSSADAHIDSILDAHEHIGAIHHTMTVGGVKHQFRVHHPGQIDHTVPGQDKGYALNKYKLPENEKLQPTMRDMALQFNKHRNHKAYIKPGTGTGNVTHKQGRKNLPEN